MEGTWATAPDLACTSQPKICASKGTFLPSQPTICSVKGSQPPPPPLVQEAPAGQVRAWLHLAGPYCTNLPGPPRLPPHWLNPFSPTSSRNSLPSCLQFSQAPSHLPVPVHAAPSAKGLSSWQTVLFLQAGPNLLRNIPWVLLELLDVPLPPLWLRTPPLCRNEVGGLPGTWARLVSALLLLAVGFSLAARQLHAGGGATGTSDSVVPPPSGHSHHPGVYHHGAIISPAGQKSSGRGGDQIAGPRPLPMMVPFLLQPPAPTWAKSCLLPGAMSWMRELEQRCVWPWCILTPQG